MGEEIQTSGNGSWSAAGGLEEVEKKGLPTLPLPPEVGERENGNSNGKRPSAPPKMGLVQTMCCGAGNLYAGTMDEAKLEQVPAPSDTPHTAESPSLPLGVMREFEVSSFKPRSVCLTHSFQVSLTTCLQQESQVSGGSQDSLDSPTLNKTSQGTNSAVEVAVD